jgi:hypothetical protein
LVSVFNIPASGAHMASAKSAITAALASANISDAVLNTAAHFATKTLLLRFSSDDIATTENVQAALDKV